jgi:hypothetical protein
LQAGGTVGDVRLPGMATPLSAAILWIAGKSWEFPDDTESE